jgi:hypothetical protein
LRYDPAQLNTGSSNSKEWAEYPEDLIKLVMMKPVSRPRNRHQMRLFKMWEHSRCFRITKKTFVPSK